MNHDNRNLRYYLSVARTLHFVGPLSMGLLSAVDSGQHRAASKVNVVSITKLMTCSCYLSGWSFKFLCLLLTAQLPSNRRSPMASSHIRGGLSARPKERTLQRGHDVQYPADPAKHGLTSKPLTMQHIVPRCHGSQPHDTPRKGTSRLPIPTLAEYIFDL